MKLQFKILGFEICSLTLDSEQSDVIASRPVVTETEKRARKAVGKVIGRISTAWVATGMRS